MYAIDAQREFRLAPKLINSHIRPTNFEKMKVKYAVQVLSASVASALRTLVTLGLLPSDALATAEFIENMDNLFDVFNSSNENSKKQHKEAFTGTESEQAFLLSLKTYLSNIKIYNKANKDLSNKVKAFDKWIHNINSLLNL